MTRRIPVISTIIVVAAVLIMIALGFWQLGRMDEKADLLARYQNAVSAADEAAFPFTGDGTDLLFRRSRLTCETVTSIEPVAGTSDRGQKGWVQRATCGTGVLVDLGFSRDPASPDWQGGAVTGMIAQGPRLVADPPVAGLEPLAKPDPADLPNNHLAYAGQWFFFALTALIIYGLALRRRQG